MFDPIEKLQEYVRHASVSADSKFKDGMAGAQKFLTELFKRMGFQVQVVPTDLHPVIVAKRMGKQRIIADGAEIVRRQPDIILGSWCGKKFRPEKVAARAGWEAVPAVLHGQLFEIKSPDILQPGPAALTDGVHKLHAHIVRWMDMDLRRRAPA